MLEIGINTNCECGDTFSETCRNIKKAGFDNVMVAFKAGNAEENVKEALSQGLKIPYVHLTTRFADNMWAKGTSNFDYIESVKREIQLCSKYNIPIAVLHGTTGNAAQKALPPSTEALDSMKKILDYAEECKVKIALENLDKPNFENFTFLLDNLKSEYFGLCYDAGHHHLYFPEFDILGKYGDRLLAVHLHDNLMDWEFGWDYSRDLHQLPFDGKIDFEKVCEKLGKAGYNNVVMLELHKVAIKESKYNITVEAYLGEAKKRAIILAEKIEKYRKKAY